MYKKTIDKDLKRIYLRIFRNCLKSPNIWGGETYFICYPEGLSDIRLDTGNKNSKYYNIFEIRNNNGTIFTMKIKFYDLRTKYLLYQLKIYMKNKDHYKHIENANNILRKSLGIKYERLNKLNELKKTKKIKLISLIF